MAKNRLQSTETFFIALRKPCGLLILISIGCMHIFKSISMLIHTNTKNTRIDGAVKRQMDQQTEATQTAMLERANYAMYWWRR